MRNPARAAKTISGYIAAAPKPAQAPLRQMRAAVEAAASEAAGKISYGMVGYKLNGRALVYFGAFKNHIGFYPMRRDFLKKFAPALQKYGVSAGTLRFPLGKPLPLALIRRLVKERAKLNMK